MRFVRALAGPLFVVAGLLHFTRTRWYESIMPDYLPAHRELVYVRLPCQAVFIALVRAAMR
jgi:uncharacterized membrane protein